MLLSFRSAALLLLHLSLPPPPPPPPQLFSLPCHRCAFLWPFPYSSRRPPPLPIKTQPTHRRNSNSNSNSDVVPGGDDDCVVCLNAFKDAQWCRTLSACGHVFHMRCVDSWLAKVAACPICRAPVRSNAARMGSSVVSLEEEEKISGVFGRGC